MEFSHIPVLPEETLELMALQPGMTVVDGTVGLGGHALLFAERLGPEGHLIGIDRDENALSLASKRLKAAPGRVTLLHGRYADMPQLLDVQGIKSPDRVFLDIGVSSLQLDRAERGFSFMRDGPLDMRMDASGGETAAELVARLPEAELAEIFWRFGEERKSRAIARSIVETRAKETINTTGRLAEIIGRTLGRRGRIHPATKTFQALRMAVNDELGELDRGLEAAFRMLQPGGRLLVIAFHSLEDRMVKTRTREWDAAGAGRLLRRKAVKACRREELENPRARSARLRGVERLSGGEA